MSRHARRTTIAVGPYLLVQLAHERGYAVAHAGPGRIRYAYCRPAGPHGRPSPVALPMVDAVRLMQRLQREDSRHPP